MSADTIRLTATYGIALLTLIGCFVLLIFPSQVTQDSLIPFITGVVGSILGFVFNRESTTAGQRSAERAVSLGASTSNPSPTVTTSSGPPATVTVTPQTEVSTK